MVKNWLITGGCGFLGTSLIKHLRTNNLAASIRVLDNLTVGTRDDLASVCECNEVDISSLSLPESSIVQLAVGDIRDAETCKKCCHDMDVIIHLAANTGVPVSVEKPRLDMESNVIGTFNMLEGARAHKVKRFVFASSGAPAGECEPPIHEELPPHPVSPYGASKLAGEGYCSAYYKSFGVETVALRFSNVYGPGSTHKASVVAKFIKQALNGETLVIYGDGTQTRDFIYIDDLINALVLSATKEGIGGETFQIATSRETTLDEITELMLKVFTENGIAIPNVEKTAPRLGDVKRNFSDTSKALKYLNWQCKWDLPSGMDKTVTWFLETPTR
jgi:UDP-glucose 4-epimerase